MAKLARLWCWMGFHQVEYLHFHKRAERRFVCVRCDWARMMGDWLVELCQLWQGDGQLLSLREVRPALLRFGQLLGQALTHDDVPAAQGIQAHGGLPMGQGDRMSTELTPLTDQSTVIVNLLQRAATDEAFDLNKLEKLLDVKERWEAEEARKAFVAALAAFKKTPPTLVERSEGGLPGTKGAGPATTTHPWGDVASQVAAGLAAHGLSHSWAVEQEPRRCHGHLYVDP